MMAGCSRCGISGHSIDECPDRLEDQFGTTADEDSHASRIAAQLALADAEEDDNE